jgi:hypothetical protein
VEGKVVSNKTPTKYDLVVLLGNIPLKIDNFAKVPGHEARFIDLNDLLIEVNDCLATGEATSPQKFLDRQEAAFAG